MDETMVEVSVVVSVVCMVAFSIMTPLAAIRELPCCMEGKKRVHQKAIRSPRSTMRCFRMKRITSAKNMRAANINSRSNQSAFSSAVTSCFEVPSKPVSTS